MPTILNPCLRKCQPAPVALLATALRNAMQTLEASPADVARWVGVDTRTVKRWRSGQYAVAVEKLMLSKRLWPRFLDELVILRAAELDGRLALVADGKH